jgi:hypothetical protein|tara:strand:+ start:471 stop:653 length:183 start_codon:yes stop_codon:yes gene_type:complete
MSEQIVETACENCRIEISTDGIEVDSSTGNLYLEALVLTFVVFIVAILYVGKKVVDKKFK